MAIMEDLLEEGLIGWLFILGVIIGSIVGGHYYLSKRRFYQLARKIPGPRGAPFIGNLSLYTKGIDDGYDDVWDMAGVNDVFKLWLGLKRLLVVIQNPADIEVLLTNRNHTEKCWESELLEPWLGDGLSIASGKNWEYQRKTVTPVLHLNVLKYFIPLFGKKSKAFVNSLQKVVGKEFDCYHHMSNAVMEMLLGAALGVTVEDGKGYATAVRKMGEIIRKRQRNVLLQHDFVFFLTNLAKEQEELLTAIHAYTRQVIKERKKEFVKNEKSLYKMLKTSNDINGNNKIDCNQNQLINSKKENDGERNLSLLDVMVDLYQDGFAMVDREIQNHIDTIIMEGHEAMSVTSSFFMMVMAERPDIQVKCVEELNSIFTDQERSVKYEDTLEMKYLERCVMETLRMYPPVQFIARELKEELKLVSTNVTIPSNSTVIVDIHKLHMRGDEYPAPHAFDPDNFLLENSASRHFYSYVPFSAGLRSCVGRKFSMLSLKVLLSTILRYYEVKPANGETETRVHWRGMIKRKEGFNIRLEPRNSFK